MNEPVSGMQHLISGTNLPECWFKVQAFFVFLLIDVRCLRVRPELRVH
jgi:hypothetical protein